jgi:DNA-binding GntR family transcriptional regulator
MAFVRSTVPLHHQIAQVLRQRIKDGAYAALRNFPTESRLGAEFGVSRTTVRQALQQLKSEGLIQSRRGFGTQGVPPIKHKGVVRAAGDPLHGSFAGKPRIIRMGPVTAPLKVATFLSLPADSTVFCVVRTHDLRGKPLSVVVSYLELRYGQSFTLSALRNSTMHELLFQQHNIAQSRSVHRIQIWRADAEVAALLKIGLADPVLNIQSSVYAADQTPIRWTENYFKEDMYEYTSEMQWSDPG